MGCWDVFCFICGNPCHSAKYMIQTYLDDLEHYKQLQKKDKLDNREKKIMKYYKKQYANYSSTYLTKLRDILTKSRWMDKCSFLTLDNKVVHNVKEEACNVSFTDKKGNYYEHLSMAYDGYGNPGVFIHTDCLQYVNNKLKMNLKAKHLVLTEFLNSKCLPIDYGIIEDYWNQDFDFLRIIDDNNTHLCISPLLKGKNIKQINSNISQAKIKKDDRPSPSVSATFYSNGDHKIGNNNKIWYIKNGKWNEIKEQTITEEIELSKKHTKFLYTLPNLGLTSKYPMFLLSRNNKKFTVLTTQSFMDEKF